MNWVALFCCLLALFTAVEIVFTKPDKSEKDN